MADGKWAVASGYSKRPGYGDEKPIGRTGFVTWSEPTPGEAAFMEAAALFAREAIKGQGTADVHRQVASMLSRHGLRHIRGRTLEAAREAIPEGFRDTWDRKTLEMPTFP